MYKPGCICFSIFMFKWCTFSFAFVSFFLGTTDFNAAYAGRPVIDLSGPVLEYETLANEKTHPFTINGRVLPAKASKSWHIAVNRFKSVQDCLVPGQRSLEKPDLRQIDWSQMTKQAYLSVCLHRIFSSMNSIDLARRWFISQGLSNIVEYSGPIRTTISGKRTSVEGISINASHVPKETGVMLVAKSWFAGLVNSRFVHNETLSATWTSDGALLGAGYSHTVNYF